MKIFLVLPFLLLASCAGKKQSVENRQQDLLEEMGRIKASYFKTVDSLDKIKAADTAAATQQLTDSLIYAADQAKTQILIRLQKELDSLVMTDAQSKPGK